jgi:hypothetical protein
LLFALVGQETVKLELAAGLDGYTTGISRLTFTPELIVVVAEVVATDVVVVVFPDAPALFRKLV